MKLSITIGEIILYADLYDNQTAKAVYDSLPIQSSFNTWGDEIYFSIPTKITEPPVRDVLEIGELAIWPPGNAFCIFYGKTPASQNNEPRAADATVPFGKIKGDATVLRGINESRLAIQAVQS